MLAADRKGDALGWIVVGLSAVAAAATFVATISGTRQLDRLDTALSAAAPTAHTGGGSG